MTHRLPNILCSGLLLALAACYDNDSPTAEPLPRPGSATIVPDWGDAEDTAVRTLVMAYGEDGSLSPGSLSHENLTPGHYRAFAYTPAAQHLAVEGGIASIKWCNDKFTDEPLYWQNTVDQHTIYAYYPYTANVTNYTVPVSIKQDQNTETAAADYEASDVLWAKHTGKAQNNLPLPLGHRMSLVTVTLEKGDGYGQDEEMPTIKKVELLKKGSFQLEGTMKLVDGDVTASPAAADATPATALTTYAYESDYRAILLPDELISNTEGFIRITLADNTTYTYQPTAAITTTANTKYNFALKLNKAGVDLSGLTIGKWGETEPISGNADMDIK